MAIDLSGRVCLVTGAAQGIGETVARGFAARGAVVAATDLQPPEHLGAALALAYDVADPEQAGPVVEQVLARFGRLDVFVANAGIYPRHTWDALSVDDWRKVVGINLDGAWYGAQAAARPMAQQGYGKIVFVSSVEVVLGRPLHQHYDAAKMGVIGLTRSLARAVGGHGVRVNAIMPGAVRTPTELEQNPDQAAVARRMDQDQCLPGRITPESIEPVFAWLASEESDVVTGQVVCADQGLVHW